MMTAEEQEYNEFLKEASIKAMELQEKYNNLSDNNKRSFLLYIEPMVLARGTQEFINQMNILFNTEKNMMFVQKTSH